MDFSKIIENNNKKKFESKKPLLKVEEKIPSPDFVDNYEVPPLI